MRDSRCPCGGMLRSEYGCWMRCDVCHRWVEIVLWASKMGERLNRTMVMIAGGKRP